MTGLRTRMLPAAKTTRKEPLTVIDRPLIRWVVDEARDVGIEHIVRRSIDQVAEVAGVVDRDRLTDVVVTAAIMGDTVTSCTSDAPTTC